MRIAVVMASSGVDEEGMAERQAYLQKSVSPETEVVMLPNPQAPAAIVDVYESHLSAIHVTRLVCEAEGRGFDAAVIWCGDDPGLESARQRVSIPVVAPATASISVARMLGDTFGYVSSNGSESHIWNRARGAGLGERLKSVACLPIEVLEIRSDLDYTYRLSEEAIKRGTSQGAHSFIIGCMAMWGMAGELTRRTGAPVIDGGQAAVISAEMLVRMNLAQSRVAYPVSSAGKQCRLGEGE